MQIKYQTKIFINKINILWLKILLLTIQSIKLLIGSSSAKILTK